jgi:DNA-binding NtrC family response regulator
MTYICLWFMPVHQNPTIMSIQSCFLIDDDDDDREIFALALRRANGINNCIMAANGLDAVKIINESDITPAYIFVDLNMPLMSGRDCLQAIKRSRLASIPVIVYTTSSNFKDIEDTQQLGASHYLVKPTSVSRLSTMLTGIFNSGALPYFLTADSR